MPVRGTEVSRLKNGPAAGASLDCKAPTGTKAQLVGSAGGVLNHLLHKWVQIVP